MSPRSARAMFALVHDPMGVGIGGRPTPQVPIVDHTGKQNAARVVAVDMDRPPDAASEIEPATPAASAITVYWRPGCGYCSSLFRRLDQHSIVYGRVNIWEDPSAAARVREAAMGNEVVPTVMVAEIPLVNPSVHQIMDAASRWAPDAVPEGYQPKRSLLDRLRRA